MDKFLLITTIALVCSGEFFLTLAQEAVKNHHHHDQSSTRNETAGYCYKRVPYHEAARYNQTTSYRVPEHGDYSNSRPTQRWNVTYDSHGNGWVMVLDCCEGYRRNPTTNRCESECECLHGTCVRGVCTCNSGWYQVQGGCQPICRTPCPLNAYCAKPDICYCRPDYETNDYGECQPVCRGGCANGECIAPNVCRCRRGYSMNQMGRCEPSCEGGCQHGQCVAPGMCSCDPGYTNPPGEREVCQPDCGPENCNGGQCISPGVCRCRSGYTRDPRTNNCTPLCRSGCTTNEECVAPDRCDCKPNYQRDPYSRMCIRSTGSSGQQDSRDCRRPCVNGVCIGYDVCNCLEGYTYDPSDMTRTRCIPSCSGGCVNGVCSGPNLCLCLPGFRKDRSNKHSQVCVPAHNSY